jgi:hypothetical protein
MEKGDHSPFSILVGIALSEQSEGYMGNLCVHPGSHIRLFDLLNVHSAMTSSNPSRSYNDFYDGFNRPDLGEPTQLLLQTGN